MVHDYHVMSTESILFKLQDVTFCNKKTFPLLNNVVYTLLYKKVFYLWAKIKLFIWQWNYS